MRRARAEFDAREISATASPATSASVAVRVWLSSSSASAGRTTTSRLVRVVRPPSHSNTVSPIMVAAYMPICGGVIGQIAPTSRPS
jgi:hypothetical protein